MGISNFGNSSAKDKIIEGNITYVSEEYSLSRCSSCTNCCTLSILVKNKKEKEIVDNLQEDELYCLKHKKVRRKWSDCPNGYSKIKKKFKGYMSEGVWYESTNTCYSFKDIIGKEHEKSITSSINNCFDKNGEQCYLGDVCLTDKGDICIFVHDLKKNRDSLINLLSYPTFTKNLTVNEEIILPKIDKNFEIIYTLYELKLFSKDIKDFIKEVKSKKKRNKF